VVAAFCFLIAVLVIQVGCADQRPPGSLAFAGSAVGREGEILRRELVSFEARHPGTTVEIRAA
jgi:hypothetical protein